MAVQEQRSVVTEEPIQPAAVQSSRTAVPRAASTQPGGAELARRVVVLIFGLIQIVIGLRIVLLLLDARTGNALVAGILNVSQGLVGPFEGILRTNALQSGGSMLDVTAIVALVGWTLLEVIVLWAIGIFRHDSVSVA